MIKLDYSLSNDPEVHLSKETLSAAVQLPKGLILWAPWMLLLNTPFSLAGI